jgi:hypothetical protein
MPPKEKGPYWYMFFIYKTDISYPFEHGAVFNYTLDGVSVTTSVFPNSVLARKEIAQGFQHKANGDFKTVPEFNGCDRRKLRMDQQHCSYSTIRT